MTDSSSRGMYPSTLVQYSSYTNSDDFSLTFFSWHRSEEHTSELQSRLHLVCRLLLEKKKRIEKLAVARQAVNCPSVICEPATSTSSSRETVPKRIDAVVNERAMTDLRDDLPSVTMRR